jgi:hypothetical protein
MTNDDQNTPARHVTGDDERPTEETAETPTSETPAAESPGEARGDQQPAAGDEGNPAASESAEPADNRPMEERLERLGGEPAPVITPEEFARLQKAGQVHIDARGRVRTSRRSNAEAGVSLRKRRAWYHRS